MSAHDSRESVPVLVTGGDHQGLAAVRCLGRHGVPVYVCDDEHSIARYSTYCRRFFRAPPALDADRYADFLDQLGTRHELQGAVLFPDNDRQVYAISRHRGTLANRFRVTVPEWSIIRKLYIKAETYELARALDIPVPFTWSVADYHRHEEGLSFPVILKPSIRDHYYPYTKTKAVRANDAAGLKNALKEMARVIPEQEILIQELIPGAPHGLYSAGVLIWQGRVVASGVGRRFRQHPMDFGHATTIAELVDQPELVVMAGKILSAIGYEGIAEVEFLRDERDGRFKLIEINPRIWGWHLLLIANGIELPYYLYRLVLGLDLPPIAVRPNVVRWIRMVTDIPTVFGEWRRGRMRLVEWWRSLRGPKQYSVWAADDPLPCIMEGLLLPYLYWKRGF